MVEAYLLELNTFNVRLVDNLKKYSQVLCVQVISTKYEEYLMTEIHINLALCLRWSSKLIDKEERKVFNIGRRQVG